MTQQELKKQKEQLVINKREDILLILASMQIYLDCVDNIKGTMLYSKKAKFHASNYMREVAKMETVLTLRRQDDTSENYNKSMDEYTQISQACEQFIRRVLRVEQGATMTSFNNDLEAILKKYNV